MKSFTTSTVKKNLDDIVSRVGSRKEHVAITRNGRRIAVIVPVDEYKYWKKVRAVEDEEDLRDAKAALREYDKKGGVSLEDFEKELGYK